MRFGIMAMQVNALIPKDLLPEDALAKAIGFDHAALISQLADHGFDLIELGGDLTLFLPQSFAPPAIEKLAKVKDERGLSFTVHLPLWSVEPSTPLAPVREGSGDLDLSICFDTGHVLVGLSGQVDLFDALEQCLPRLGEVHLHDGPYPGPDQQIGYGKDHQPLGKGDLDVGRLIDRLEEVNFDGPVVFELKAEEALHSLEVIGGLRPGAISGQLLR